MEQFEITDARTLPLEVRRQKEIKQLHDLIKVREERAQSAERYLRLFGKRLSAERVQMLQRHLKRTIDSIWEMRQDLDALQYPPPCSC